MNTTTIAGRSLTRSKILAAVAECDRLGSRAFLDRYGYRRASRWHLRANGRSYPSKAIVGVAAGLRSSEFFGGAAGAVRALTALGFAVRSADGTLESTKHDILRRMCEREGLDVREPSWPRTENQPTAYFASGSNQTAEIRALGYVGADIGVAAPHVGKPAEAELLALRGTDVQVFVDSGAFSEVKFGPAGREVVKPMRDADWQAVLGLYERLSVLGEQLWIVAPDCVGDQQETLQRLWCYSHRVRALRGAGVRILVPVQKGELSQTAFAARIDEALGFEDWIPALPCKKAATSAREVAVFVANRLPQHVHLLGLGIRNRRLGSYLDALAGTSVSLDSCWIAANVGRAGGGRRLTRARDAARPKLAQTGVTTVKVSELAVYCCLAGGLA